MKNAAESADAKRFNYREILLAQTATGPVPQSAILELYPSMDVSELRGAARQLRGEGEITINEFLPPTGTVYSRM